MNNHDEKDIIAIILLYIYLVQRIVISIISRRIKFVPFFETFRDICKNFHNNRYTIKVIRI